MALDARVQPYCATVNARGTCRHAASAKQFNLLKARLRRTFAPLHNPWPPVTLPPQSPSPAPAAPPSIAAIFLVFARIGLLSFGGGLSGWVFREVVVLRDWVNEDEFLSGLALGQILPGTNIANLSVYIGQKLRGVAGAAAALGGLLSGPFVAVILVASLYNRFKSVPYSDAAMDGVAAAAIGLLLIIVVRGARRAGRKPAGAIALVATFVGVAVLHLSLLLVVAVIGPLSVLAAWLGARADA